MVVPKHTAVLLMLLGVLVALGCVHPRSRPQSDCSVTVDDVAKYSVRAASAPVIPEMPSTTQESTASLPVEEDDRRAFSCIWKSWS